MSETWDPTTGPDHTTAGEQATPPTGPASAPSGAESGPQYGRAIPLPPVGGAPVAPGLPFHGAAEGGGYDQTGPLPLTGQGPPTPPAGTWAPPAWGAAPTVGGAPTYLGWPPAGAPVAPAAPTKPGNGLLMALASVAVVVAVVAGVGLGHVVWPSSSTPVSASPAAGSGGSSGASGSGSFPFGNGSSGGGSYPFGNGSSGSGSSGNTSTGAGAPSDISAIAAKVSPALVDINTNLSYQNEQAAGTGMVLTSNGVVLTNNHVIDGATSISATDVGNGKSYSATVVGYDRTGDIAVIKLTGASGLQTVSTSSGTAAVGQAVVGVGQRRRHRRHPQRRRRVDHRPRPVHHGQRQRRWQCREPDRAHRGQRRHPARRLRWLPGQHLGPGDRDGHRGVGRLRLPGVGHPGLRHPHRDGAVGGPQDHRRAGVLDHPHRADRLPRTGHLAVVGQTGRDGFGNGTARERRRWRLVILGCRGLPGLDRLGRRQGRRGGRRHRSTASTAPPSPRPPTSAT